MPRPSIFGGSWLNNENAGSRYANLDNWPDNSNDNIGARGRSDDRNWARRRSRSRRSSTTAYQRVRWSAHLSCFGEYTTRSGRAGRRERSLFETRGRHFLGAQMTKRYRNLIGRIVSPENMREAYRLVARGKRMSAAYLDFKEYDGLNLSVLAEDMAAGRYRSGTPSEFYVFDPKKRLISALPFYDRVAQQALCLVIGPIFEATLLPRAFACRPGKGVHAGVVQLQSEMPASEVFYCADERYAPTNTKWFSPIHMPRWASRLTLEVMAVKTECLQDISREDAIAEGIGWSKRSEGYSSEPEDGGPHYHGSDPRRSFESLFCWLHGDEVWDNNPEVVALSFSVHRQNVDTFKKLREAA
jgi:hypothetical protein